MLKQQKTSIKYVIIGKILIAAVFFIILYDLVAQISLMRKQQEEINSMAESYLSNFNQFQVRMNKTFPKIESIPDEKVREVYMIKQKIELIAQIFENDKRNLQQDFMTPKDFYQIGEFQQKIEEQNKMVSFLHTHSKQFIRKKRTNFFSELAKDSTFSDSHIQNALGLARFNLLTNFIEVTQRHKWELENKLQEVRFQQKYRINNYIKQLPLCIIINTRNNAKDYQFESTLQSIINQEYLNYRLVIMDNASTDNTLQNIQIFLQHNKISSSKYVIIGNDKKKPFALNIYNAITQHCDTDDIAVLMKGADQLLGSNIFSLLNAVYRLRNVPILYTNHFYGNTQVHKLTKGHSQNYLLNQKQNQYRLTKPKIGPLITFKVDLFMRIKVEDLKQNERWSQSQQSFVFPMLEMACGKVQFLNQYVFFHKSDAQINDEIIQPITKSFSQVVRKKSPYECLQQFKAQQKL